MSMHTLPVFAADTTPQQACAPLTGWSLARPMVVGVDDTKQSYVALKYAAELSQRSGSDVHLVSAIKPVRGMGSGSPMEARTTELRLELREVYLEDLLPKVVAPPVWTRIAKVGDPSDILASEASNVRAGMIILGAGRYGPVDRILPRGTALRAIQKVNIPIVVVPSGGHAPQTAVVGVDFSPASLFACHAAAAMLGETGSLHLVFIEPLQSVPGEAWSPDLSRWEMFNTIDRLGEYERAINAPKGVVVKRVVLTGDIASTLKRYAASIGAELIAVGSHGYNLAQRTFLGSVSAALVERPAQAVLVAPSIQ